jgi:hypothetical protein
MKVEQSAASELAAGLKYAGKAPATDGGGTDPAGTDEAGTDEASTDEASTGGLSRVGTEGTTMQELRFVAVSEDGRYAVLAIPGRSARFTLPIDERLRAVALGQTSRLAQYEIEVESPLRPKEIQARIRAGETVEEIADAAGIAVERVRWFEGPVLAERAYMADQAQAASVRRHGESMPSAPGPRLGEIVAQRLNAIGVDPDGAQWDAKKRADGSWQVQLTFTSGDRLRVAEWVFDPRRRHVLPADDNAARMSLPGVEPAQLAPPPGEATVTQLAPRLRPGPGRTLGTESAPPAPSMPTIRPAGTAETRKEAARPPAAERNSWPLATSQEPLQEPLQAPLVATADSAHNEHPPIPAAAEPVTAPPAAAADAAEQAEPAAEHSERQGRKAARNRRSSVPSWDEIMFGSSRQHD